MNFVKFFGRNTTAESLADGIKQEVKAWEIGANQSDPAVRASLL